MRWLFCVIGCLTVLAACGPRDGANRAAAPTPDYLGIETRLLDGDLVGFLVTMDGAASKIDVELYARCAAAQYALIRGYGFARHVRTRVYTESSQWRGDAVYTVSPSLPAGTQAIDAEVTVADCIERGIPTV